MTLQLLICTFGDGILRIPKLLLPTMQGVSYLVSWQQPVGYTPCALPDEIVARPDVEVVTLPGRGLSQNRNNCLRHASADLCLICDDDCRYTPEGLLAVISTFDQHPEVDIATFIAKNSAEPKHYPDHSFNLRKRVRNFYVISFEIAFRRASVAGKVAFNEHFGLGADLFGAGEEAVFIHDALSQGLHCQYFPIQVVEHIGPTTSVTRLADDKVLRADGAILYLSFRRTMWLRLPIMAWRKHKGGVPFAHALSCIRQGIDEMRHL